MSSKKLGFYFALFQSDPSNHTLKLWIDGDDFCEFYTWDDFFEMIKDYDEVKRERVFNNGSLYTSSVWFWDVDKGISKIAKRTVAKEELPNNATRLVSTVLKGAYTPNKGQEVIEAFSQDDLNLIFKNG